MNIDIQIKNLQDLSTGEHSLEEVVKLANEDMDLGVCPECKAKKVKETYVSDPVDYHREFECLNCGFTASE
jgi:hypothetical protein